MVKHKGTVAVFQFAKKGFNRILLLLVRTGVTVTVLCINKLVLKPLLFRMGGHQVVCTLC